ncbi:hypothetical protein Psed_7025 (plasmid) [Pseudonocardia dioxanivorans CB1190]|uniref:Uncharacterized protein n=1 Tax=Pseudonocardia dioxanivorans (strain ATCC 55486 / DSM 44775 / JCM 13855 / CB1190) TaxID=675635 RepID=F2L7A9_PSEUX|nr:hypothetical protein Psed_7025 [Pseudonocardia dioxanivorans CB1190]
MTVVMAIAGATLLYGAIKNRNPIDVIKLTLQGKDIKGAKPLSGSGDPNNLTAPPGAIPGGSLPGTPQAGDDARTDPKSFDPKRSDVLPRLPGEGNYRAQPY